LARKILLADDSVTAQNMGRKILADAGYEVITVNNGSAALKKIAELKPDLIVLDVYMPGYSGLEVCQRLKDVGETARIPVLLTVGKLEPFKPEEAKRVRADGFIVKPFEASELLSALSKLEDKVVPRAEPSKPGRFARAAAIEEGRYDKTMAVEDDNSGWKNRIAFPPKKKEKPVQEEVDTAEIYNPVNKDLRTVIEQSGPRPAPAADAPVNLSALAPEGLPKDVTPEEIAALAAAAAQIKGTALADKPAPPVEMSVTPPTGVDAPRPESIEETRAAEPVPASQIVAAVPAATFAEQENAEKIDENKLEPISTQADLMNAIMGLETQVIAVHSLTSEHLSGSNGAASATQEPVTMAVAAVPDTAVIPSRWTAVAIALPAEEAAISLEQEMQKAYAAFAAADGARSATVSTLLQETPAPSDSGSSVAGRSEASGAETASIQALNAIPLAATPEIAQPAVAAAEAATEAISAAVKELEAVAAKYEAEQSTHSPEADKANPDDSLPTEPTPVSERPLNTEQKLSEQNEIEQKVEEKPAEQIEDPGGKQAEPLVYDAASAPTVEFAIPQFAQHEIAPQIANHEIAPGIHAIGAPEAPAPVPAAEVPEALAQTQEKTEALQENSSSEKDSTEPVPVSGALTRGGTDDMAKRESETAQAWASWRKIRETGGPKSPAELSGKEQEEIDLPQDRAAMAVAVGAESSPEAVAGSFDSDPEIASIVDSVLADMRPKIVEEIARKLGKKK
jgi:two-component system chemotaxis response regulator CheY